MRRLIWILLAIPVLLLAAAFILPAVVDWTSYRDRIETAVTEASGLRLSVEGDIGLSLLPQPRLRLQKVVWSDGEDRLAEVPQIDASLSLGDLLSGEARITALSLIAPAIEPGREGRVLTEAEALLGGPLAGKLEEVKVAGAAWSFATGRRLVIDHLLIERSLRGQAASYQFDLIGEAWLRPLTARGRLHGFGDCEGPVTLEATLEGVLQETRFSGQWRCGAAGLELSGLLAARGPDLVALLGLGTEESAAEIGPAFTLDGPLAWQAGTLDLPAISLGFGGQESELRLAYRPGAEGSLEGEVRLPLLDLDGGENAALLVVARQALRFLAEAFPRVGLDLVLDNWRYRGASAGASRARLEVAGDGARLKDLALDLPAAGSLTFAGSLSLDDVAASDGRLTLVSEDLRGLLAWLGAPEALLPTERLRRLSLETAVGGTAAALRLDDLTLALDTMQAKGHAIWQEAAGGDARGLPALSLALDAGALNLDAYGGMRLVRLFEAAGAGLRLDLALTAEQVLLAGEPARGLALTVRSAGQSLQLDSLSLADLFGARLDAKGRLDLAADQLALDLTLAGPLSGLPLVQAALPAGTASGKDYRLDLTLEGPLSAPALAGEAALLGGRLFFSGLLDGENGPRGDWAVNLEHGDLGVLLASLGLPLRPKEAAAVDLSGLLRFGEAWSLEDLSGRLGPLELLAGRIVLAGPVEAALSVATLDPSAWRWDETEAGRPAGGWDDLALALATEDWPFAGRLSLDARQLIVGDWTLAGVEALADAEAPGRASLRLSGSSGEGNVKALLSRAGERADLQVDARDLPLGPLLPSLPQVADPAGSVTGQAELSWRLGGLPTLLESLEGKAVASGRVRLNRAKELDPAMPPARLGHRILQALIGDAASGLARVANLTAGIVRLFERVLGQDFAFDLAAEAEAGRIVIQRGGLTSADILAKAEGWIDLADWRIDTTWSLSFEGQGGEPYYRERMSGPLGAPDILRDGLLFRGVTPPG